jgi:hypothetical protein
MVLANLIVITDAATISLSIVFGIITLLLYNHRTASGRSCSNTLETLLVAFSVSCTIILVTLARVDAWKEQKRLEKDPVPKPGELPYAEQTGPLLVIKKTFFYAAIYLTRVESLSSNHRSTTRVMVGSNVLHCKVLGISPGSFKKYPACTGGFCRISCGRICWLYSYESHMV